MAYFVDLDAVAARAEAAFAQQASTLCALGRDQNNKVVVDEARWRPPSYRQEGYYGPVQIETPTDEDAAGAPLSAADPSTSASVSTGSAIAVQGGSRKRPPRVRKPARNNDRCVAPTTDLDAHRESLRQAFGNTLSDEFAEVMLGKLVSGLRPGPFDSLDEATLNAAIALISSVNPQTELDALLAVQIAATGFAGLKFLRQSQHHMDEVYIDVYGGYATKLFRLQLELIQAIDRRQRGNKQTVEVRHVHIHSGAQGVVVGIVNAAEKREGDSKK